MTGDYVGDVSGDLGSVFLKFGGRVVLLVLPSIGELV
jgi:hypothetical protein